MVWPFVVIACIWNNSPDLFARHDCYHLAKMEDRAECERFRTETQHIYERAGGSLFCLERPWPAKRGGRE
jgi:hypothetical protein